MSFDVVLDNVREQLERGGVLARVRADLRLAVLSVLDERVRQAGGVHLANSVVSALQTDEDGTLCSLHWCAARSVVHCQVTAT